MRSTSPRWACARPADFARITGVKVNFAVADIAALQWPDEHLRRRGRDLLPVRRPAAARAHLSRASSRCLKPRRHAWCCRATTREAAASTARAARRSASHMYTPRAAARGLRGDGILELREYEAELPRGAGAPGALGAGGHGGAASARRNRARRCTPARPVGAGTKASRAARKSGYAYRLSCAAKLRVAAAESLQGAPT